MKVIFLGTQEFSCICLEYILKSKHKVVAVVTQPDKPSGRGHKLVEPKIKAIAKQNNIPVYQFEKIRRDGVEDLKKIDADIMVTASYGQILSQEIIDICPHKIINVHASLLPKYRGASPIQYALMNGDKVTGVTIMRTEAGIDTGDMLISSKVQIDDDDNFETLTQKLAHEGGQLAVKALDMIQEGNVVWIPQNEKEATFTKMIKIEDTILDFNKSAKQLVNLTRALSPNLGAKFNIGEITYKVFKLSETILQLQVPNGTIIESSPKKGLVIKCQNGAVEVEELQAPGGKIMTAKSFLNGKKIETGIIVNA